MKKKNIFIVNLINSIIVNIVLIYLFTKFSSGKLFLVPFILIGIIILVRNIFILIEKPKYVNLFNKLIIVVFLLFWFGFLIYWCYLNLISKNYGMLILSIPFWIVGIASIKKNIFKSKNIIVKAKKQSKFNFAIVVSSFLIFITFTAGIFMLFFGIKDTYNLNKKAKNYKEVQGYFEDYSVYSNNSDDTSYKLTYSYIVNGKNYKVTTDFGTSIIPEKGSVKMIKYNPNNPNEAFITGSNSKVFLIVMGIMFTVIPLIILFGMLYTFGYFKNILINIIDFSIGFIFIAIGFGVIYIITGKFSLIDIFTSSGTSYIIPLLIPILFIIVGIFQLSKSLIVRLKKIGGKK